MIDRERIIQEYKAIYGADENSPRASAYSEGHVEFAEHIANLVRKEVISQREIYQHGFKAGERAAEARLQPKAAICFSVDRDNYTIFGKVDAVDAACEIFTERHVLKARSEEYSEALRQLAFYVGNGGYNAEDPISGAVFYAKIKDGIDGYIDRIEALQEKLKAARGAAFSEGIRSGEIEKEHDFLKEALAAAIADARYYEDRWKEAQQEVLERGKALVEVGGERKALQAKIENGIRMYAVNLAGWEAVQAFEHDTTDKKPNATLILD